MKSSTSSFNVNGSKMLSNLSCPIMAIGIFGLIRMQPNTLLWWGLIIMSCAIIIFESTKYKKTEKETANTASDEDLK